MRLTLLTTLGSPLTTHTAHHTHHALRTTCYNECTQANVCLMQHAADAVVSASVAHATNTLYARAGINLAEVMQRATAG
jgi:hypothetical protein